MINYNGTLTSKPDIVIYQNRAFLYGDAVFETLKVLNRKVLFLEDHYFRLMASMRILRMEIPMNFTMEYLEEQVLLLVNTLNESMAYRVRISVFRKSGGYYLPLNNDIEFIITVEPLDKSVYAFSEDKYEVDLFKDFYISKQLLSTIKSTNKMIHISGSIFANENGLDNCLLLNDEKNVVEALQGNLFMFKDNKLITPPVSDGCLNGIMRKQILSIAKKIEEIQVEEISISPFDLQKADELFITNVINGIQPVTGYRKKQFSNTLAAKLQKNLNAKILLSS